AHTWHTIQRYSTACVIASRTKITPKLEPQERQTCRPQKLNPTQLRHSACSRSNPLQLVFMMKAAEYWLHYNPVVVRNVMPVDQQFGDRDVWVGNSRSKA